MNTNQTPQIVATWSQLRSAAVAAERDLAERIRAEQALLKQRMEAAEVAQQDAARKARNEAFAVASDALKAVAKTVIADHEPTLTESEQGRDYFALGCSCGHDFNGVGMGRIHKGQLVKTLDEDWTRHVAEAVMDAAGITEDYCEANEDLSRYEVRSAFWWGSILRNDADDAEALRLEAVREEESKKARAEWEAQQRREAESHADDLADGAASLADPLDE